VDTSNYAPYSRAYFADLIFVVSQLSRKLGHSKISHHRVALSYFRILLLEGGGEGGQIQILGEQSYVSYLVKPVPNRMPSQRHYVRNFIILIIVVIT
jgi:hypothetical protein